MMNIHDVNPLYAVLSFLLAFGVVGGLLMQALAVVKQGKSIIGVPIKFLALFGFLAVLYQVRHNPLPYVVVFLVSAVVALTGGMLARRALLR